MSRTEKITGETVNINEKNKEQEIAKKMTPVTSHDSIS
jgi:hypothetical protein